MAKVIDVKITGDRDVARMLARLGSRGPKAINDALHQEALELEAESVPLVPLKNNPLRNSSRVIPVDRGYTVGYYKGYALWVHEIETTKSGKPINYSAPGTGAKFLQRPFEARQKGMLKRIRDRVMQYLEK